MLALMLCLAIQDRKDKPVELAQVIEEEYARRIEYQRALEDSRITGNQVKPRELQDQQARERAKMVGRYFKGEVAVVRINAQALTTRPYVVVGQVKEFPSELVLLQPVDGEDSILRDLRRGSRLSVRGVLGKENVYENCAFELIKDPPKEKAKPITKQPKEVKSKLTDDQKASDRLKVAKQLMDEGFYSQGRNRLQMLIRDYPKSGSAAEAKKMLGID